LGVVVLIPLPTAICPSIQNVVEVVAAQLFLR